MNTSQEQPCKRRRNGVSLEVLEDRQLLSAGMGSTFAIVPGSVDKAGQVSSVQFKIDPTMFTAGRGGKITLGIDIAADSTASSPVKPQIVSVKDASGHVTMVQHSRYSASIVKSSSGDAVLLATLVTLPVPEVTGPREMQPATQVERTGPPASTWSARSPGDAKGTWTLYATNLETIMSEKVLVYLHDGLEPDSPSTPTTPAATARSRSPTSRSPPRTWGRRRRSAP